VHVDDLTALRRDSDGDAEWTGEGRGPRAARDDDAPGDVRVGARGNAGDATALDEDAIGAGVEHRDVSPRARLQQRLVEEPPIDPRGDPVEHGPERTGERGKHLAGLLGCDLAYLVGRR